MFTDLKCRSLVSQRFAKLSKNNSSGHNLATPEQFARLVNEDISVPFHFFDFRPPYSVVQHFPLLSLLLRLIYLHCCFCLVSDNSLHPKAKKRDFIVICHTIDSEADSSFERSVFAGVIAAP